MNVAQYKEETGAKRFRRTKEEIARGLSPEQALQERLSIPVKADPSPNPLTNDAKRIRGSTSHKGDITIRIRPAAGTDASYFERVPGEPLEIVLDEKWYGWFDSLVASPFEGDANKLMEYIMNQGIGAVLTKYHFPSDLQPV